MGEETVSGRKEGTFVHRYTGKEAAGESGGSRYPEKQGLREQRRGSRYPEKNPRMMKPEHGALRNHENAAGTAQMPKQPAGAAQMAENRRNAADTGQALRKREGSVGTAQISKRPAGAADSAQAQDKRENMTASVRVPEKSAGVEDMARESGKRGSTAVSGQTSGTMDQMRTSGKRESTAAPAQTLEKSAGAGNASQVPKTQAGAAKAAQVQKGSSSMPRWKQLLRERKLRRLRIAAGCFLGVIAVLYLAAAVYFSSHFYEGTVIYGVDCSQMTEQEAMEAVADRLGEYKLTLEERGGITETVSARQIELKFVDNGSTGRALSEQRSWLWPVMMLIGKSGQARVSFTYSQAKVEKLLDQMDCFNELLTVSPQDAYIGTTERGFEVVPEVEGNTLDREKALEAVLEALDAGAQTLSFEEKDCYLKPQLYQDDKQLNQDAASMNELVQADIIYDFGDRSEEVNVSVIKDWILRLDDGSFVIDDTKVQQFVAELADRYDTFGMERDFYTAYDTVVTLSGGDYGWAIDQDATTLALLRALEEGYRGEMEPVYLYTAMSRDTNDIGYTYVEICISQQRMICYKDGVVVADTPVVTGNPNKGNATPAGSVWAIDAKMRNYVLVGEGYQAPVDYWIPFNGNIGIHDMKARAYFGSTIYLTNGSHGCVNTPYDQVAVIYEAVSIGTPVIVYENP